jgi:hydroxyacylglutathione hydrolase
MPSAIKTIRLPMPFHLGSVNCYLLKADSGCMLIDTACGNSRRELEGELGECADRLKLIVLTHGDFDHSGNAARLRRSLGAKIAMHRSDAPMVANGDIFAGRRKSNFFFRRLAPIIFSFGKTERFEPDLYLEDGDDLGQYGFAAKIIHIPGHSNGSIGVLTAEGDFFSGDLVIKNKKPEPNKIIDDPAAAEASLKKLKSLKIKTVYPGHGRPFALSEMG